VFSDAVGMRDEDVTAYQDQISSMIMELSLETISIFNLDEWCSGMGFPQMRKNLTEKYAESIEVVQEKVRLGKDENADSDCRELHRLYCGITRFLVEDAMHPGQQKSRSAIQKECRLRAYEVIQKSGAWSRLIEDQFPHAVRLSIHPQGCGSQKLGLRLMGPDGWMTPWHGVAVKKDGQFLLLKRNQAEKLGAQLVFKNGRPSHYELTEEQKIGVANEL
jgi:pyoverdine/dityrosine biosynthesis protein Dit1